jgi:hypothetical protein
MRFQNAVARIALAGAYIPGKNPPTLDALLAGIVYDWTQDVRRALDVPLDRTDRVAHGSRAIFETPFQKHGTVIQYGTLLNESAKVPSFAENVRANWKRKYDTIRREIPTTSSVYEAVTTPAIWFLFRGDIRAVETILRMASRIGARRNSSSHGTIESITVETIDNTEPLFGIVGGGKVLRPVPLEFERHLPEGTRYNSGSYESWINPYHDPRSKAECLVPPTPDGFLTCAPTDVMDLVA